MNNKGFVSLPGERCSIERGRLLARGALYCCDIIQNGGSINFGLRILLLCHVDRRPA